jgi:nitrile hydratase accessory protein
MSAAATARLQLAPGQPTDQEGPVFTAPWEASAFAIVVKLFEAGYFTWPEWVECLSKEIAAAEAEHHDDDHDHEHAAVDAGSEYYHQWFAALERMIVEKNIMVKSDIDVRHQYLRDNPVPHDHVARRDPVKVA